jgi:hypothetical protein
MGQHLFQKFAEDQLSPVHRLFFFVPELRVELNADSDEVA